MTKKLKFFCFVKVWVHQAFGLMKIFFYAFPSQKAKMLILVGLGRRTRRALGRTSL